MGEEKDVAKQISASPGKLALIGVLTVVLLGVLYIQFGSSETEETPITTQLRRPMAQASDVSPVVPIRKDDESVESYAEDMGDPEDQIVWESRDLETVIQHDPFALPPAFPQPLMLADGSLARLLSRGQDPEHLANAEKQTRAELERLQNQGVGMIVKQRDGYVAVIGDQMIQVGDEINGFKVIAIDSNGVHVEWKVQ